MDDENMRDIGRLMDAFLQPLHEQIAELQARSSAQRYLLEQVYANQFLSDADGFAAFMDGLSNFARQQPTKVGPVSDEAAQEQLVRIKVHLDRFRDAVLVRISQGLQS